MSAQKAARLRLFHILLSRSAIRGSIIIHLFLTCRLYDRVHESTVVLVLPSFAYDYMTERHCCRAREISCCAKRFSFSSPPSSSIITSRLSRQPFNAKRLVHRLSPMILATATRPDGPTEEQKVLHYGADHRSSISTNVRDGPVS